MNRPGLTYVEGFVQGIHHAWVVDSEGNVIDTTWPHDPKQLFRGVPLRTEWVAGRILRHGEYLALLHEATSDSAALFPDKQSGIQMPQTLLETNGIFISGEAQNARNQ